MEWSNKYNPMNSDKGLAYVEHYKEILDWMSNPALYELPPPIEASLDPIAACNNKCYYCSSNKYIGTEKNIKRWGIDYFDDLFCHLAEWGVKGFCWGGRESTLNLRLAEATRMGVGLGLEGAIVTNGVYLPDDLLDALLLCKWIGISVDSCDPDVYKRVRGTDDCEKVWHNIVRLTTKNKDTTIGVRALVLPETVDTILDTCRAAKLAGATFFHVRPADLERSDLKIAQKMNLDIPKIQGIFEKCHEMETEDFKVFTITHKYDESFKVVHKFKKCLASPLVMQLCADKRKYICVDHRLDPKYEVKEWGSEQHLNLIKSIVPDRDCSRCTWGEYNRQIEEVVIGDKCHLNFP